MKITIEIENFTFEADVKKIGDNLIQVNDHELDSAHFVNWLGDRALGLLDKESGSEQSKI